MLQRGGKVRAEVISDSKQITMIPNVQSTSRKALPFTLRKPTLTGTSIPTESKTSGPVSYTHLGTIFEDSPIRLDKWMLAMWQVVNCKNGVSSYEVHRAIGVTQKTAWFMDHRIRYAIQDEGHGGKLGRCV